MRVLPVLAIAALLALAGCAAPNAHAGDGATAPDASLETTTDGAPSNESTTTGTDESEAAVDADGVPPASSLPVNDVESFRNLLEMLDVDADRPLLVTRDLSGNFQPRTTTRTRLLGLEEYAEDPGDDPHGLAVSTNRIYVQPAGASPAVLEQVVVHEQFHTVQFQQGWLSRTRPATTDGRLAMDGATEGAAVWIVGEYTERFQREDVPRQVTVVREAVRNGPDGWRLFRAPYYFGARWTAHHVDDPANVSWVYENPPRTTEQLMHNRSAGEEPVKPVSVAVRSDRVAASTSDRLGEAYVWATLRGELDAATARRAAAGWGGDELRMVGGPGWRVENLTWAIRWDTPRDAHEFEVAAREWRGERDANASFRIVRVNETITLLLAGDERFVDAANVTLNGTNVVVTDATATTSNRSAVTTNRSAVTYPPSSAMAASRSR